MCHSAAGREAQGGGGRSGRRTAYISCAGAPWLSKLNRLVRGHCFRRLVPGHGTTRSDIRLQSSALYLMAVTTQYIFPTPWHVSNKHVCMHTSSIRMRSEVTEKHTPGKAGKGGGARDRALDRERRSDHKRMRYQCRLGHTYCKNDSGPCRVRPI